MHVCVVLKSFFCGKENLIFEQFCIHYDQKRKTCNKKICAHDVCMCSNWLRWKECAVQKTREGNTVLEKNVQNAKTMLDVVGKKAASLAWRDPQFLLNEKNVIRGNDV